LPTPPATLLLSFPDEEEEPLRGRGYGRWWSAIPPPERTRFFKVRRREGEGEDGEGRFDYGKVGGSGVWWEPVPLVRASTS
jgi:hypothetical protein